MVHCFFHLPIYRSVLKITGTFEDRATLAEHGHAIEIIDAQNRTRSRSIKIYLARIPRDRFLHIYVNRLR